MKQEFAFPHYLDRVGYRGALGATEETLFALHRAQVFSIPFENLDPLMGRSVHLEPEALVEKLIHRKRGGYCFELNGLFLLALQSLGYSTRSLAARVSIREGFYSKRSHQITLIEGNNRRWIADVGFGGNGLLEPIPLEIGREVDQTLERFRIMADEAYGYRLEHVLKDQWRTLYAFSLDPYLAVDYQLMNYYTSQSPDSIFTRVPLCSIPKGKQRIILYGDELKIRDAEEKTSVPVKT
ncbi:MAG: arylamine N-acetyltransferase, partial [Chthoniobacterales bacterium]